MYYQLNVLAQAKGQRLRAQHPELHKHVRLLLRGIWSPIGCDPKTSNVFEQCSMCLDCEMT